ncbi:MAG: cytochrome P450 [Betaproteobacteria bacterium]
MAAPFPPGPARPIFGSLIAPGRDPLQLFTGLARTHGDLVHFRMTGEHVFLVSRPDIIRDVLVTSSRNFTKSRGLERAKNLLGEGLLTSEGASHLRSRRLLQPAFHRERIAAYATVMAEYAEREASRWTAGAPFDAAQAMSRLTLAIVGRTLFDADVEASADEVGDALTRVLNTFWVTLLPFSGLIERLPVPTFRRGRAARARLDAIIYRLIAHRRASGRDHGDLLSMLLQAQDEESGGGGFTDRQVRDEAMTLLLAGHETTANALTWTWYLLGQAPEVERKLHEEIDSVLGGRLPQAADVARLPFVERVVTEAMRLYPPAWMIGRRAIAEQPLDGYVAPPRSIVFMSQWVVHRDRRWFEEPERFAPDRWTPAFRTSLPKFAYFPFGGGPRQCIGEPFAWMELVLLVSTIARRWRLRPVPGHPVVPQPLVTLRAKHGLQVTAERR